MQHNYFGILALSLTVGLLAIGCATKKPSEQVGTTGETTNTEKASQTVTTTAPGRHDKAPGVEVRREKADPAIATRLLSIEVNDTDIRVLPGALVPATYEVEISNVASRMITATLRGQGVALEYPIGPNRTTDERVDFLEGRYELVVTFEGSKGRLTKTLVVSEAKQ